MEVLQWALGILVTIHVIVTGVLWHVIWTHVNEYKKDNQHFTDRLSLLEGDMTRAKEDIGTHDTGMRGAIHRTAQLCQEHEFHLKAQARERGKQ